MARCYWCDGTGKFKKPRDEEKYNELFDRFDAPGTLTMEECRYRALKKAGYDIIECPYCGGSGEKDGIL